MAMTWKDWADMASVYRAGAQRSRGWVFNINRQQEAEVLEAMAERCDQIADERNQT